MRESSHEYQPEHWSVLHHALKKPSLFSAYLPANRAAFISSFETAPLLPTQLSINNRAASTSAAFRNSQPFLRPPALVFGNPPFSRCSIEAHPVGHLFSLCIGSSLRFSFLLHHNLALTPCTSALHSSPFNIHFFHRKNLCQRVDITQTPFELLIVRGSLFTSFARRHRRKSASPPTPPNLSTPASLQAPRSIQFKSVALPPSSLQWVTSLLSFRFFLPLSTFDDFGSPHRLLCNLVLCYVLVSYLQRQHLH